ncbi:MAG: DUF4364 family protein [Ruminococcaceae bacterium]|nr:DUF4364 family protein [Oscillospiraceae bacterium]
MGSPIGSKRNVKIFVLYLMQNVHIPLDYITLGEMVMHTDYVAYLDLAEAFHEMLDDGLLEAIDKNERGEDRYIPTAKGICVAESMRSDLLPSILDESLGTALRYLDFKRRGVKISSHIEKNSEGVGYHLHLKVTEQGVSLMDVTLWVDSQLRAEHMAERFRARPENVYKGITALLSGNVDYLLN